MSQSLDERGRLFVPKDVRERFGETYRIVELPATSHSSRLTKTHERALVRLSVGPSRGTTSTS